MHRHPARRPFLQVITLTVLAISLPFQPLTSEASAQLTSSTASATMPASAPRVFLDCQGPIQCDRNHFRTEIRFVNWAQDRADSDVHVIATSQAVGGGGRQVTLDFIGLGGMDGISDRLTYTSSGTDVQAETLDGLTQALRLGLMRYAIESGLGRNFDVLYSGAVGGLDGEEGSSAQAVVVAPIDRWNYWTFSTGLSGNMNLRETSENLRLNPRFSADRVTEDWKIGLETNVNLVRNSRQLSDGREIRDDRNDWEVDGLIVRSMTGNFSTGMTFRGENSVSGNRDARIEFAPAVEYNIYPYLQANRRQFTVRYAAGLQHSNYIEETVFHQVSETRPVHNLNVRYSAREQWGNAGMGVNYEQYLNEAGLYSAGLNGNLNLRITRGLELQMNGNASWVHNEIHIPLSSISDEDILLGRVNLPSAYQYNGSVGLSYRWGSSFTNIVNTRFNSNRF